MTTTQEIHTRLIKMVQTQQEVADHFWTKFQQHGKPYSKSARAFIRKGQKGEAIVTSIYGEVETKYTIDNDDTYVVMGKTNARECYCIQSHEFQENYITEEPVEPTIATIQNKGFQEYRSRRQILALEATSEDMEFFGSNKDGEAHFVAPWGETTLVKEEDILATTFPLNDKKEVYRIERSIFEETYEPTRT